MTKQYFLDKNQLVSPHTQDISIALYNNMIQYMYWP